MKSILIIEDDLNIQEVYRRWLGNKKHEYACATTAERAIAYLYSMSFDHVICDFRLAEGTGRDVYEWLKENRPNYLDRLTFVCGDPSDVAGLQSRVFQKATLGLKQALNDRVDGIDV